MSYQNSYIPRLPELDLEEDSYLLPQLCSVPPELEVPELVIPIPNTKTSYTRTIPSVKPCYRTQHYSRGAEHSAPYRISERDSSHQSGAPWRQVPDQNPSQETPTKKQWRRKRTVFSPDEMAILIQYYDQHKFLNPALKAEILSKIDVPGNVLVMWFQNRRAKDRANGIVL
ncbi:homeobox protein MSX-2-like [Bolinopsis microptera]|uniref:homeobox protein MSX-2-like n=1 Tax=Bolinopsis microptera TaxID=2820187 RepID=UPI003078B92E